MYGIAGNMLASGVVGALGPSALAYVATAEMVSKINQHVFLPIMEGATRQVWGVLGEDPMKTEQELTYLRSHYFTPVFDAVDNSVKYVKDYAENVLGVDLDRDGVIGQHEGVEPQGVNISGPPPKAIVKVSDMDSPQEVKLTVSTEAEAPKPKEPLAKSEEQKQSF